MPTPIGGGNVPMPSPMVGAGGRPQTPASMQMPTPGGGAVVPAVVPGVSPMVGMAMPSPSLGAGAVPQQQLKFNGYGQYAGLLCHSPHRVLFEDDLYPTALHLFEAHKFLGGRPDLADRIRQCERVEEVTTLSAEMGDFARGDWGNVALATVSRL
jgi:hypothetical protein